MLKFEENLASRVSGALQPMLGVQVTVTASNGLVATLYADDESTVLDNPLKTDANGYFGFKAANGEYTLTFAGAQIETATRKIELYDADDDPPLTLAQAAGAAGTERIGGTWFGGVAATAAQLGAPEGASLIGHGEKSVGEVLDTIEGATPIVNLKADNKRIVVIGSSSAYGTGATANQGYMYKLAQRLAPKGYTVVNKAVPGRTSMDLLSTFYSEVVPETPDVVIISLTLSNDGILGANKEFVYQRFMDNMHALIKRCRQLGYRVIVTTILANNAFSDVEYDYIKQANEEFETTDVALVNLLGCIEDGTGKIRAGMYYDGLHANNIGHESYSRAFPLSLFDRLTPGMVPERMVVAGKRGFVMQASGAPACFEFVPDSPIGSFTFMAFVRRPAGAPASRIPLAVAYADPAYVVNPIRINISSDPWALAVLLYNNVPMGQNSTKNSSDATLDHLALTYDYHTSTAKLWVNGTVEVTMTALASAFSRFLIGGRGDAGNSFTPVGYEFRDIAVYRAALNPSQMKQASNGVYPKASLEILSPCADMEFKPNMRLKNLAPTASCFRNVSGVAHTAKNVVE